jgi:hypothetical protein
VSQAASTQSWADSRWRRPVMVAVGFSIVVCCLGALLDLNRLLQAYLVAYLFWLGISLGCFALLMIQYLTGGRWGSALRGPLEAGVTVVPLLALLFVPIALGVHRLYPWAHPPSDDPLLEQKSLYLNVPFFVLRAVFYFAAWIVVALLLVRWSEAHERNRDAASARRLQLLSGPGLIVYGLCMTFASVDWIMSLEPHWFSSIFGVIVAASQILSAFAFCILVLFYQTSAAPGGTAPPVDLWHDLGNLLLAFVMIWTYVSFSQFLLIWSGNLPEEIAWYGHRAQGAWAAVVWLLVLFNFTLPFLALLMRGVKRQPNRLSMVAACVLFFSVVNLYWLVAPSFGAHGAEDDADSRTPWWAGIWLDLASLGAIGGVWLLVFGRNLQRRPLESEFHLAPVADA